MTAPRFHQSYVKTLLRDCPALLRIQMTRERTATRAMEAGSLLDYLVFGQNDRYEVVDARYKSGPRAGEPATDWLGAESREQREQVRARGLLPVLECEIAELQPTATAIRSRITLLANEMAGPYERQIVYQPTMQWRSELGVECEGTPDVVVLVTMRDLVKVCTIDVKHTAFLQPKRFNRQVDEMMWDVQGHAYREGSATWAEEETGLHAFHQEHVILATSSIELGLPTCARPLSPAFMAGGKRRWERGQRLWRTCIETNEWESYSEEPAEPSHFYVHAEIEAFDESQQSIDEEP